VNQTKSIVQRKKLKIACWALFFAGTLVQLAAPRLRIEHNQFVIPQSMVSAQHRSPAAIVARERWMQFLSAALTGSGGLGLALVYGRAFLRSRARGFASLTRPNRISGGHRGAVV
jgi:hypothetical protein